MVAGYVPSTTSRKAIGSLVLGVYDDGKLHPCRPGRHRLTPQRWPRICSSRLERICASTRARLPNA